MRGGVSMITFILKKIFGTKNDREVKRLSRVVERINALEPQMQVLSDAQLREKTDEFRERIAAGETLDALLPEAFAVAREASLRVLGMRHYDVQLIGGMVLHAGKIAEMKTGEGKTLVATLAVYLNALAGKGVHLVTVNDYLARRDAEWMMPLYNFLGVSVGIIQSDDGDLQRKAAYACDITYGTNSQFGFDYLRDNMKFDIAQYVQRDLAYAIVDEVDSILIDGAQTPLIISGAAEKSSALYIAADRTVRRLAKDTDYEVDEKGRSVHLTESGTDLVERTLGLDNLYSPEHTLVLHHVNQALRAHALFRRDVEYVVHNDEILIVDENTGRVLAGHRYNEGLHQAIEAKEGVTIERESQTLATITLQNFFRLYKKCSGMTGTAQTEAEEFHSIYKLEVVAIPTNRPVQRIDENDLVFLNKEGKFRAILTDIVECHRRRQPVLVGTVSVEMSEEIGFLLGKLGVPFNLLNAKQHEREADIVAHAGEAGSVTIATNMAGRGTDIKLTEEARAAGGLRIIGTERHKSRRIDNQLRGRAGRQGDVGSSRFYLALSDELFKRFGGDGLQERMQRLGMREDEPIEGAILSSVIEDSQERAEKQNFDQRKSLLEYDDVMNQQRKVVYSFRRHVLEGADRTHALVHDLLSDYVDDVFCAVAQDAPLADDALSSVLAVLSHATQQPEDELRRVIERETTLEGQYEAMAIHLKGVYDALRSAIDSEVIANAEKWTLLEVVDNHWKIHLQVVDALKEGMHLRGYGQKNPVLEYKKEAFEAFMDMMRTVKQDVITSLLRLDPALFSSEKIAAIEAERQQELESALEVSAEGEEGEAAPQPEQRTAPKVGRNDLCVCGSGKKSKHCCGRLR